MSRSPATTVVPRSALQRKRNSCLICSRHWRRPASGWHRPSGRQTRTHSNVPTRATPARRCWTPPTFWCGTTLTTQVRLRCTGGWPASAECSDGPGEPADDRGTVGPLEEQRMNNEPEPDRGNSGGSGAPLAAGVVLIVLGLIFLLRNLTGWHLNNWWALFILAPGLVLLWNGYQNMQADGRLSSRALQSFTGGSVMLLVSDRKS